MRGRKRMMTRGSFFAFIMLFLALCATASPRAAAKISGAHPSNVAHYEIDATFGPDHSIGATVRVRLPAAIANSEPAFIIGRRFEIEVETDPRASISIEDIETPIPHTRLISVKLDEPAKAPIEVIFTYHGPLNAGERVGYAISATEDQIELRGEMAWYPVFHTFNLRFTLDAEFKGAPAGFIAVAPGLITQNGEKIRIRRETPDIDAPFVAARGLTKRTAKGVEIYAADFDWTITDMFRRHAISAAAYFQEWFGPLPADAVRVVVLPTSSGSYATRGYIVTNEGREAAARVEEIPETGPARLIAHEFAHAWWAPVDLLSENRWLAESMAEFLGLRYVEHAFGLTKAHEMLERKRMRAEAAGPMLGAGRPGSDSSYMRGPFLLFALEKKIGRGALDQLIGKLSRKPPSETSAFMAALSEIAGADAAAYFDTLMRSGAGPWEEEASDATSEAN